jgi:hypothetical protein
VFFLDPLNGGAWPLLVGGVICLVDSVNGRDPSRLLEIEILTNDSNLTLGSGQRQLPLDDFFFAGFLVLRKVRFWATAGL